MALLLITGEAGAANDVFKRCVSLAEEESCAGNATTVDFTQQRAVSGCLESSFERAAIHAEMTGDVGYADLIMAVAPDVVHGGSRQRVGGGNDGV